MPGTHHDLSMISYVVIGVFVVGHELAGLQMALILAVCLGLPLLSLSLLVGLVLHGREM